MTTEPRFPIGTRFIPAGRKVKNVWRVVDIWRTYDSAGNLVRVRYVAAHDFLGQTVTDCDVIETTIARGLVA